MDRLTALGQPHSKDYTVGAGKVAARVWREHFGQPPRIAYRAKTGGTGTHAFAVYPPDLFPAVDAAIMEFVTRKAATLPAPPPVEPPPAISEAQVENLLPTSQRGFAASLAALTIDVLTGHKQRLLWCVDLERDVGPDADSPLDPTNPDTSPTRWGAVLHQFKGALERQPHIGQQCEVGMIVRYTVPAHGQKAECTFALPYGVALTVLGAYQPTVGKHLIWPVPPGTSSRYEGDQLPDSFWFDGIPF